MTKQLASIQGAEKFRRTRWLLVAATAGLGAANALAREAKSADAWHYELTPYLWASRMEGNVKAGPLPKTSVDMKFSDILDSLDAGFMAAFEARKGRWGLLFDGIYMKVSDSARVSQAGLTVNGELELKQTMLAGAVAYRAMQGDIPLDLVGGLRYTKIDADARIDASLFALAGTVKRAADRDWTDPYVGLRAIYPVADKWKAVGYVDVGGFGVGSDFTWQGSLGLDYAYSESVTAKLGYRYLKVDYDKDGFRYDMANDGLYLGVGFLF